MKNESLIITCGQLLFPTGLITERKILEEGLYRTSATCIPFTLNSKICLNQTKDLNQIIIFTFSTAFSVDNLWCDWGSPWAWTATHQKQDEDWIRQRTEGSSDVSRSCGWLPCHCDWSKDLHLAVVGWGPVRSCLHRYKHLRTSADHSEEPSDGGGHMQVHIVTQVPGGPQSAVACF